ncbi:hypothetical protein AC579_703 [Pseudocercospora musae]|uniref:Uncharacterized protein n=1 Tax=Pseudocercospora musae TaxID=113226 RepID=A0A139ICK6_9PEZI|nr:hypothetical protein AC579_703 [Pseudocercospora musae]
MDLLPALPSKAYATRLFNNRPKELRFNELVAVAYYYTNKELIDRDNEDRVASGASPRGENSNIITKWITEAVQYSATENNILPSLMRRLFDIRRYNILKFKDVSDKQSVRSLHSLVVSDHHAPKFVKFSDNPTWEDLKPYLGKQWGRPPDAIWPALLSFVGTEGRNMEDLREILKHMEKRTTEESAYGLVADIRRLAPPIKDILENHKDKTERLKRYAEAEVRKIKNEDLSVAKKTSKKTPRKKVLSQQDEPKKVTPRKTAPKKEPATKVKSKKAESKKAESKKAESKNPESKKAESKKAESKKAAVSRPLRSSKPKRVTRQDPQPTPDASPSPERSPEPSAIPSTDEGLESEIEVIATTAPADPPDSPASTPEPSAETSVTPAPTTLPAIQTLSIAPASTPSPATHDIHDRLIVWSGWLGVSFAEALNQSQEDKIVFGHFMNQNEHTLHSLESSEHQFFCYMLATLVSWFLLPVATRMRPYQHLEAAAVLFLTTNHTLNFFPFNHDIFKNGDDHAKAWYLLLLGLCTKGMIDPLGLEGFQLAQVVKTFGNTVEKEGLAYFVAQCKKSGAIPRYVDPGTERHITVRALQLYLGEKAQPANSLLMQCFFDAIQTTFSPYEFDEEMSVGYYYSLSDAPLAEATAKLAQGLKMISSSNSISPPPPPPPGSFFDIAKNLAKELGKDVFDTAYLCPYIGFFEGEFPGNTALEELGKYKLPKEMTWQEAGKKIGEAIRGWLEKYGVEERGVWEYVLAKME